MWLLESSARLVPPTAVPQGVSAGVPTPWSITPGVTPLGLESPESPEEKFTEIPSDAAKRLIWLK